MLLIRALQVCERKGLLFYELLGRLRRIGDEFGEAAAWEELALQTAIQNERSEWEQEQQELNNRR